MGEQTKVQRAAVDFENAVAEVEEARRHLRTALQAVENAGRRLGGASLEQYHEESEEAARREYEKTEVINDAVHVAVGYAESALNGPVVMAIDQMRKAAWAARELA